MTTKRKRRAESRRDVRFNNIEREISEWRKDMAGNTERLAKVFRKKRSNQGGAGRGRRQDSDSDSSESDQESDSDDSDESEEEESENTLYTLISEDIKESTREEEALTESTKSAGGPGRKHLSDGRHPCSSRLEAHKQVDPRNHRSCKSRE